MFDDDFIQSIRHASTASDIATIHMKGEEIIGQSEKIPSSIFLDPGFKEEYQLVDLLLYFSFSPDGQVPEALLESLVSDTEIYDSELIDTLSFYICFKHCSVTFINNVLISHQSGIAPIASPSARYSIAAFVGVSQNTRYIGVVEDLVKKCRHYYSTKLLMDILSNFDFPIEKDFDRSITIREAVGKIFIEADERFTGYSTCPECSFFPCRINTEYFHGAIQNCRLWNKSDPASLGEIVDQRDWGEAIQAASERIDTSASDLKKKWSKAQGLLQSQSYQSAIIELCAVLSLIERNDLVSDSSYIPLAWIYLSYCFDIEGESRLAYIALREANRTKGLLSQQKKQEHNFLNKYNEDISYIIPNDRIERKKQKAFLPDGVNYKSQGLWVKAFDFYSEENIISEGNSAADWTYLAECNMQLGEYALAELFMTHSIKVAKEARLRKKFSAQLDDYKRQARSASDCGLSKKARQKGRVPEKTIIENGINMQTYCFVDLPDRVLPIIEHANGIGYFFDKAKIGYEKNDAQYVLEIFQAAVNYSGTYSSKAGMLDCCATALIAMGKYSQAKWYLELAMKLKPDNDFQENYEQVCKQLDLESRSLKNRLLHRLKSPWG